MCKCLGPVRVRRSKYTLLLSFTIHYYYHSLYTIIIIPRRGVSAWYNCNITTKAGTRNWQHWEQNSRNRPISVSQFGQTRFRQHNNWAVSVINTEGKTQELKSRNITGADITWTEPWVWWTLRVRRKNWNREMSVWLNKVFITQQQGSGCDEH